MDSPVGTSSAAGLTIPTVFEEVDETLHGGLRGGQLTLIAGIAGVGTSTFALGLARHAGLRERLRTLVLAPDSSKREILIRVIAAEGELPVSHLRGGRLDDSDRHRLDAHREALTGAPAPLVVKAVSIQGSADDLHESARTWLSRGVQLLVLDGIS